jgi:3-hydroxybutyrate dehydrogenase
VEVGSLAGRTALVTGSTSGIGLAIAQALAAEGANIVLNGLGERAVVEQIQQDIAATGVEVDYRMADLSQADEVHALVAAAIARFGAVDILVNNAGIQHVAPVEHFPAEKWNAVIALNLSACFHAIAAALPSMRERGWGRIINVASTHGLVASAEKSAYVAAKHGVLGLTKAVALETARTGITCNAICPGWVLTPLVQQQIDARARNQGIDAARAQTELLSEKQPSLEFVRPEELGALALFLCGPHAGQIRGASYVMDGGWTAQ